MWEIAAFRDLAVMLFIGWFLWVCVQLQAIVVPVLIGLGLAYLTDPVLDYVEHAWKLPRWLAVTMMVILICALVTGMGFWVGPILSDQVRLLIEKAPAYLSVLANHHGVHLEEITKSLSSFSADFQNNPVSTLKTLLSGTGQVLYMTNLIIGTVGSFLFSLSLVVIYFFFFAWSFPSIQRSVWHMVESMGDPRWPGLVSQMDHAVGAFFRGRLLIALLMGVMFAIGWAWAGVPYWVLLGFGAGLLSLIPYAATLAWPVAVLLKYLDVTIGSHPTDSYWMEILFWPSIVYLVVQFIEGWVLTPWIQSQSTDLSAATILVAILIGGAVAGILGLILAIPLTACLKIMAKELILPRMKWGGISGPFPTMTAHSDETILKP